MYKKLLVCISPLLFSGCATIFSGSTQNINIKVVESQNNELLEGIACTITDPSGGEYSVASNPAVVTGVRRGSGSLTVLCKKSGYKQLNVAVGDSFNNVTIVNLLFWPGFIVDGLSGAYKKYPSHYVVTMEKKNEKQ